MRQLLLLSACLLFGATLAVADDKDKKDDKKDDKKGTLLAWKFEKGKPFYQTMTTMTTQNMTVTGTKVEQKQEQTFYFMFTPTKVDKDKVILEQKIIGLKMNIDIGGSKINYDSTSTDKSQPSTRRSKPRRRTSPLAPSRPPPSRAAPRR